MAKRWVTHITMNINPHAAVMIPKKRTRIRKEEIVRAAFDVVGKKGVRALLGMIQLTALRWNSSFDIRGEAQKLWSNFLCLVS